MIFFLHKRYASLQRFAAEVAELKKNHNNVSVIGTKKALEISNNSYNYFCLKTKTVSGRLLSIIPGTKAYTARKRCAYAMSVARNFLGQVKAKVAETERQARMPRKSRSKSEPINIPTGKHYKSPIAPAAKKLDGGNTYYSEFPSTLKIK